MINFGTKVIPVTGPGRVGIRSDGEFVVYGVLGDERVCILGPKSKEARVARFDLDEQISPEVVCEDGVAWTLDVQSRSRAEVLDNTPMEIPVDVEPPSIRDEMREYIRTIISQNAEENGAGSFEEEDDFDIPDEFDPVSPYEVREMVEEYVAESPPEPAKEDKGNAAIPEEPLEEIEQENES